MLSFLEKLDLLAIAALGLLEVFGLLQFPGGVLPNMGYISKCGPKGYGF